MTNEMYKLCLKIATEAHKGKTRWDKKTPYITHPIAVAKQFADDEIGLKCMALLHDVLEDTDLTAQDLLDKGVSIEIISVVELLTRLPGTSYKDFILEIELDKHAIEVKIADIKHNLSDLKKGSLRDKYELALYILENEV